MDVELALRSELRAACRRLNLRPTDALLLAAARLLMWLAAPGLLGTESVGSAPRGCLVPRPPSSGKPACIRLVLEVWRRGQTVCVCSRRTGP